MAGIWLPVVFVVVLLVSVVHLVIVVASVDFPVLGVGIVVVVGCPAHVVCSCHCSANA